MMVIFRRVRFPCALPKSISPIRKLLAQAAFRVYFCGMKKWLIRIVLAVLILLVVVVVALGLFLAKAVKKGIETVGPELTKVSIKLDSVGLSVLSGSGKVKGLEVGNPEGYTASAAMKLGSASVAVSPGSILSDKIVVKSIRIESPELYIEGSPTKNNLTKILDNVEAAMGGGKDATKTTPSGKPAKKLQVDEFVLSGAKVSYAVPGLGKPVSFVVPDIKFANLGTGPEGITAGELTKKVMTELTERLGPLLAQEASRMGKEAIGSATNTVGEASKTLKGVTDIFKKK